MALTESTMRMALGAAAPGFALPDVISGRTFTLDLFADKRALLVMFISAHCPYVKHVEKALGKLRGDYADKSLGIAAISANDVTTHPNDAPERLRKQAEDCDFQFAYLYDESQAVAKAYHAACTPDFFLFDENRKLVYRGQFDDSRPENGKPATGADLRAAIDAVLAGGKPSAEQRASIGCNIKWKAGNEPAY